MERPICTYPAIPKYLGGDASKATSFACIEAPRNGPCARAKVLELMDLRPAPKTASMACVRAVTVPASAGSGFATPAANGLIPS